MPFGSIPMRNLICADWSSLKKTNGQWEEVNGEKVYTLYYQATERVQCNSGIGRLAQKTPTLAIIPSNGLKRDGWAPITNLSRTLNPVRPFSVYLTEMPVRPTLPT